MGNDIWRRNLITLWLAQMLALLAFSFVFPFMPFYVQVLGVRGTAAAAQWSGAIEAAAAFSMAIAQPIWGNLSDRFGRKPMVIRSMVGNCITTLLMGLATSPEQVLVLRLLQGAVTGTVAASNSMIAASTPKHRLGFALGVMQVAFFTGSTVGPLMGGIVADTFGFRAAFFCASAMMISGAVIVIKFVQDPGIQSEASASHRGVWAESRTLLAMAVFPILISVIFLNQLAGVIVSPVLSLFVAELSKANNPATVAGVMLAATAAVSAVSALAIGRIGDKVGHTLILPVCLLGAAISYFPHAFVQEVWQLFLLRILLGVFLGGLMPSANALVAKMVPHDRRGAAFGLTATASALANGVGPISGANIAAHWGLRAVFLATGLLFTISYGWVTWVFRKHKLSLSGQLTADPIIRMESPAGREGPP